MVRNIRVFVCCSETSLKYDWLCSYRLSIHDIMFFVCGKKKIFRSSRHVRRDVVPPSYWWSWYKYMMDRWNGLVHYYIASHHGIEKIMVLEILIRLFSGNWFLMDYRRYGHCVEFSKEMCHAENTHQIWSNYQLHLNNHQSTQTPRYAVKWNLITLKKATSILVLHSFNITIISLQFIMSRKGNHCMWTSWAT